MKHLWSLKVIGEDRWVRYGSGITGLPYATIDKWDSALGPPAVFSDPDMMKVVASLVPSDVKLEPVLFVVLPPDAPARLVPSSP